MFLAAPHWALEKPMKEAANILHSFDLSLSEFVVWWKFLEKLYSKIENSRRKNAREVITKLDSKSFCRYIITETVQ